MTLIPSKSQAAIDQDQLTNMVLDVARSLNVTAGVATIRSADFWQQDPERVLTILNANTPRSQAILGALKSLSAVNSLLDMIADTSLSERVPTGIPHNYSFDEESSLFTFTPDPVEISDPQE